MAGNVITLDPHDITRIWNLAIAIYDGEDPDADLRNSFVEAMRIYNELMDDFAAGGTDFEDGEHDYVSEVQDTPDGRVVRFVGTPRAPEPKKAPKAKKAAAAPPAEEKKKKKKK
jgi:hypothetical protein